MMKRLRRKDRRKRTAELSARLAPLEELEAARKRSLASGDGSKSGADDTIRVDSSQIKLPGKFYEQDDRSASGIFHLEPVAVVILLLMLAFIAFIAWQVSLMPAK